MSNPAPACRTCDGTKVLTLFTTARPCPDCVSTDSRYKELWDSILSKNPHSVDTPYGPRICDIYDTY